MLFLPFQKLGGAIHKLTGTFFAMSGSSGTHTPIECPIARLPVEILIHIVRSGLDLPSKRSLSQVSRSFRDLSFLIPEFWSIIVPKFPLEDDQLDYWKRSIANSKTVPLDVSINISEQFSCSEVDQTKGLLPLFLELINHSNRWRTFALVTECPEPMDMFLREVNPVAGFPQLENLRLACAEPRAIHGRPGEPNPIMPRLRTLTLWNIWACHPRGTLCNLVDLKIIGDLLGTMPPLGEIINALKSSPNLERLYLTAALPPLNDLHPPPVTNEALHVVLPRLRSLTFRGLSRMAGISILPLLHLPVLEEFRLENALAWLDGCMDSPHHPRVPEDYSPVFQVITFLNIPWQRSSDVFTAPPGPQWSYGKLKEVTLSWVTAEVMPLFEWLAFMHGLTTLRSHFSDTDLLRVLQDRAVCPQLQTLYVEGFMDPVTRNELERVMCARPDLEVLVDATLPGSGQIFSSLS